MTAKEYLSEIKYLREDVRISRKIVSNFHLSYSSIHGFDYSGDRVKSSPRNAIEEAAWKMLEDHNEAIQHLYRSTAEVNKRLSMIRSLSKPIYCEILLLRYYECLEMSAISRNVNKKLGTTANLHSEALAEFQQKYAETLKEAV